MGEYITVPTLERWQHYKNRNPPWIKLHRCLLTDYDFSLLPDASKAHLLSIWLLASQMDNKIPNDLAWIMKRINATTKVNLEILLNQGFISLVQDDSDMLAEGYQDAILEKRREEKRQRREEEKKNQFGIFKNVFLTEKEFSSLIERFGEVSTTERIDALSEYVKSKGKKYSDHYATILTWDRIEKKGKPQTRDDGWNM